MCYTNSRATMKCWDIHIKKIKYCLSEKIDEHDNIFSKGWSPGSAPLIGTNTSTLPTLKNDLSDHTFIKCDKFEVNINFSLIGTTIGIVAQYYEHHSMSCISRLKKHPM